MDLSCITLWARLNPFSYMVYYSVTHAGMDNYCVYVCVCVFVCMCTRTYPFVCVYVLVHMCVCTGYMTLCNVHNDMYPGCGSIHNCVRIIIRTQLCT